MLLCFACRGGGQDVETADCSSMMSGTQEACQDELEMADAMCSSSIGFSGSAAALTEASDGLPGRQLQEADWQEIVYKVGNHSVHKLLVDLVLKTPCFTLHFGPWAVGYHGGSLILYQGCQCQVEQWMCKVSISYNDSCLLKYRPAC